MMPSNELTGGYSLSDICANSALPGIPHKLFDAIGRDSLQGELLTFLNNICGADAIHLFTVDGARPDITCGVSLAGQRAADAQARRYLDGGYWRGDREMEASGNLREMAPILYRMDTRNAPTSGLRDFYRDFRFVERILTCGRTINGIIGFSVMRATPRDLVPVESLQGMGAAFAGAFSIVAKHMEVIGQSRRMVESLTSLPRIEGQLEPSGLSIREAQVAARLLYGLSASCIASDLSIGSETVNTHRKRLYEKLGIGCHRELLYWYFRNYVSNIDVDEPPFRFSS